MDKLLLLVDEISAHSMALGTLANESVESAEDCRYMASLACLFILAEQCVKLACAETEGGFNTQINQLLSTEMLSPEQVWTLHKLRQVRNTMFHESHYMNAIITENGKASLFSESDTKEQIWTDLSLPVLEICEFLVKK